MDALRGLGDALALLARQRGVSKIELGRRIGIGKSTATKLLSPSSMPNSKTLSRVLDALGCTLHDLADAVDAVNRRGIYAPGVLARAEEIAEGSPVLAGVPQSGELVGALVRKLLTSLERIDQLEAEKSTKR